MKNLITIITLISIFACKAQSPIVSLDTFGKDAPDGAYFKDINNELNKFEGTWEFTNGNTSFTIILDKKEMLFNGTDYEDELIGEYKYIENGLEVVNTLPNITNPNKAQHHISGRSIIPTDVFVACDDCTENERRVMLTFYDTERLYLASSLVLRFTQQGDNFGLETKMTATVFETNGVIIPEENSPRETRVPYGEYLMTKQ